MKLLWNQEPFRKEAVLGESIGMKKNKFARWYVKYIIKTPLVFYLFLSGGIALFLILSLRLKMDIMKTVEANVSGRKVVLEGEYDLLSNELYLYCNRNDEVFRFQIESWESAEGSTICTAADEISLSGNMNADIVIGSQTLLERIFVGTGEQR